MGKIFVFIVHGMKNIKTRNIFQLRVHACPETANSIDTGGNWLQTNHAQKDKDTE
jgi:hypothetical protein